MWRAARWSWPATLYHYLNVYYLFYIYCCAASEISVCQHVDLMLSISTNGMLAWTPDESASSCFICSGIWSSSRSDRFPADLAQIRPITTVYLIRGVFDTMTAQRSSLFYNQDGCRWCVTVVRGQRYAACLWSSTPIRQSALLKGTRHLSGYNLAAGLLPPDFYFLRFFMCGKCI